MFHRLTYAALVLLVVCGNALADNNGSWNVDSGGNWSTASNWTNSAPATGTTAIAYFTNTITASRTVTNDSSPWTIGNLVFSNTAAYGWTITNGTFNSLTNITVNGAGSTATVASALSGTNFSKYGFGSLVLTGTNSVGVTNVSGGGALVLSGGGMSNNAAAITYIGDGNNSNSVRITGSGSLWNNNGQYLYIGSSTAISNKLTVDNGGVVTNASLNAGNNALSQVTSGSSLMITNGGKIYSALANRFIVVAKNCSVMVGGGGQTSVWVLGGGVLLKKYTYRNSYASNNTFIIGANGIVTNIGGPGAPSYGG